MDHTIVHFEIPAADVGKLKAFYEGLFGWKIFHLGYVGEFLLLFVATTFLVVVALHNEAIEKTNQSIHTKENGYV